MIKNRYFQSNQDSIDTALPAPVITTKVAGKRAYKREYEALKPSLRSEYEYQKHHYKHKMGIKWDWTFDQYCEVWWNKGPMVYQFKGRKSTEYCIYPIRFGEPFGKANHVIDTNNARRIIFNTRRKKKYSPQANAKFKGIISPDGVFSQLQDFEKYYNIDRYRAYKLLKNDDIVDFLYSDKVISETKTNGLRADITTYITIQSSGPRTVTKPCIHCGKSSKSAIRACKQWVSCKY